MTTARSVISRALRLLAVIDPEETPTATQLDNGLEALNTMVHGWKAQGVDVGHEDWAIDDDVTVEVDPQHVNGMTALLAGTLQPEYPGSALSQAIGGIAASGWSGLQAAYFDSSPDSDLRPGREFRQRTRYGGGW